MVDPLKRVRFRGQDASKSRMRDLDPSFEGRRL